MLQVVCPVCFKPQASRPIERDGKPWIESYCQEHGTLSYLPKCEWSVTPAAAPVSPKPWYLNYDAATFPAPGSLVYIDRVKPYSTLCYTFGADELWYDGDGKPVELLPELLLHTIYRERMIAARSALQRRAGKESDGEAGGASDATRPFAEFVDIAGYRHIKIGGIVFPAGGCTEGGIRQDAETLNRRVTARERKAEAKVLREAADAEIEMAQTLEMTLCRSEESPIERRLNHATRVRIDFYRASAQRLRVRADAVEKGE